LLYGDSKATWQVQVSMHCFIRPISSGLLAPRVVFVCQFNVSHYLQFIDLVLCLRKVFVLNLGFCFVFNFWKHCSLFQQGRAKNVVMLSACFREVSSLNLGWVAISIAWGCPRFSGPFLENSGLSPCIRSGPVSHYFHFNYDMIRYDMWYDTIWYMIWYMIWYDIWYDTIWYMIWYDDIWCCGMIRYDDMIRYDGMIWYDIWYMISLTAIG
jgi:hypothetical protein